MSLPKKIKLTEFEWKVLKATLKIPLGQTRSYQWIAKEIGRPKAVRAVGSALGKNPFAPLVPCHRVIRSDGVLGHYSGGKNKKVELLKLEGEISRAIKSLKK